MSGDGWGLHAAWLRLHGDVGTGTRHPDSSIPKPAPFPSRFPSPSRMAISCKKDKGNFREKEAAELVSPDVGVPSATPSIRLLFQDSQILETKQPQQQSLSLSQPLFPTQPEVEFPCSGCLSLSGLPEAGPGLF